MKQAYALASERAGQKANKSKQTKVLCSALSPGDHVLVKNLGESGGLGNLRAYREDQVHIVTKRLNDDSPVHEVLPESGPKKRRILHHNLLLPCQSLPIDTTPAELRKNQDALHRGPITRSKQQSLPIQPDRYSQKNLIIQVVMKKMNLCQ